MPVRGEDEIERLVSRVDRVRYFANLLNGGFNAVQLNGEVTVIQPIQDSLGLVDLPIEFVNVSDIHLEVLNLRRCVLRCGSRWPNEGRTSHWNERSRDLNGRSVGVRSWLRQNRHTLRRYRSNEGRRSLDRIGDVRRFDDLVDLTDRLRTHSRRNVQEGGSEVCVEIGDVNAEQAQRVKRCLAVQVDRLLQRLSANCLNSQLQVYEILLCLVSACDRHDRFDLVWEEAVTLDKSPKRSLVESVLLAELDESRHVLLELEMSVSTSRDRVVVFLADTRQGCEQGSGVLELIVKTTGVGVNEIDAHCSATIDGFFGFLNDLSHLLGQSHLSGFYVRLDESKATHDGHQSRQFVRCTRAVFCDLG